MLKEPQIYEEFQFFCFHSQLILIRHPLLDSLSKIVLNHERDNIANKKCLNNSLESIYIIQAKAMHRIISLHMALFHVLFSYRQLFIFVLVLNKTLCVSIFYYSIISKQKEHIQRASNPKDVHDGH